MDTPDVAVTSDLDADWDRFLGTLAPDSPMRPIIEQSWQRCRSAGIDSAGPRLTRVDEADLIRRIDANAQLIEFARGHLAWISASLTNVPHVAYLVDQDGVVLYSTGNDALLMRDAGLLPGYDWSEARMGTNGAGTALKEGKPVAVIGPEHYCTAYQSCTCTAAPIHRPDGGLLGAVDITTPNRPGIPERLTLAAYASRMIERDLDAHWHAQQEQCVKQGTTALLTSALDAPDRLRCLGTIYVPSLADCCSIYFMPETGDGMVHLVHADPVKHRVLQQFAERVYPRADREGDLIIEVLRTGTSKVVPNYTIDDFMQVVDDPEAARLFRSLELGPLAIVPLRAGERTIGVAVLARDAGKPPFSSADLVRLEEFALAGAFAVVNAQLHEEAQRTIAELRAAERKIRGSEERLRRIAESGMTGLYFWEASGKVTYANDVFLEMIGRTQEDVEANRIDWREITAPEYRKLERGVLDQLATKGFFTAFEKEFVRPDGTRVLALCSGAAFPGMSLSGVSIVTDLTDRKRAEERLRVLADVGAFLGASLDIDATLRRLARVTVNRLADCCFIDALRPDGSIRRVVAHRDPAKDDVATRLSEYSPDIDRERFGLGRVLQHGESLLVPEISREMLEGAALDEDHLRLGLELDPQSAMIVPLIARNKIFGAITFIATTRGRRYTDEDLAFAGAVAGRAALAIDNALLYAESRQAVQERENVLAIVSHDLRNPLNTIGMASSLLLEPGLPESTRGEQAMIIRRGVDRMIKLTEDLLDATRLRAGRFSVNPAAEDARKLARAAIEAIAPLAAGKNLSVTEDCAAEVPFVWADRDRVAQVFGNLLGNAIRMTPAGGQIDVTVTRAGDGVAFTVSDTGPGISADALPQIFDQFWQGPHSSREGAGLGLSIAKGIVEAHGGHIWARNRERGGAEFCFTLPPAQ